MSNSELVRWVVVAVLVGAVIVRRLGLFDKLKEKHFEKEKLAEKVLLKEQRKERLDQQQRRVEQKKRQTAEILRQSLHGLHQKTLQVGGQEMWYAEGGTAGQGTPIVLLHGFAGDKENWDGVAQLLVEKDFHVVALDLPGWGQNPKLADQPYDVTSQAKRIRGALRQLKIQRAHLVGHSIGGTIAAAVAYGAPTAVASLTLIEPFGVRVPAESELDTLLARGLNPMVIVTPQAYDNLLGFLFHQPPSMSANLKNHRAEQAAKHRDFQLKIWQQIRGGDKAHFLELLLPEIQLSTLVLQGAQSKVVHPSTLTAIRSMMANAEGAMIEPCGHMVMVEKPAETAGRILDFLGEKD